MLSAKGRPKIADGALMSSALAGEHEMSLSSGLTKTKRAFCERKLFKEALREEISTMFFVEPRLS